MINKELLKNLNILYVEDDDEIRDNLEGVLMQFCQKIITAENGEIGLQKFLEHEDEIDLILSDITMPKMSGVEMLVQIREKNRNVPFIFTTAYTDSQYLLQAINLGVFRYAVKPINIKNLLENIEDIANIVFQKRVIENKNKESEQYLQVINSIAMVSKWNKKGEVVYANENFLEECGFVEDELLGKKEVDLFHADTPNKTIEELWGTISEGKLWEGRLKYAKKNSDIFYSDLTIYPIFNDYSKNLEEFICIGFLSTDEVQKDREFKKKVMSNIQESKSKENSLRLQIKELEGQLSKLKHIDLIENSIENQKKKNLQHKGQIEFVQNQLKEERVKYDTLIKRANEKVSTTTGELLTLKKEHKTLTTYSKKTTFELSKVKDELVKLNEMVYSQSNRIKNLNDVIASYEKEIKKLKS